MLEIFVEHYKSFGQIILYGVIVIGIYVYLFFNQIRDHINENWEIYRTNPIIMPIAGYIRPEPGITAQESTMKHIFALVGEYVKRFVSFLSMPLYPIFGMLTSILQTFGAKIDGIRSQMTIIREFLFSLFYSLFDRLQNGMIMITLLFMKLREGLKKTMGMLQMVVYTIEHSYYFLRSIIESPLGEFGKLANGLGIGLATFTFGPFGEYTWNNALCFHPHTVLHIRPNKDSVPVPTFLHNIRIGDHLKDGSVVQGIIQVTDETSVRSQCLYTLSESLIVSGCHIVWNTHTSQWCPVYEHPEATPVSFESVYPKYPSSLPYLICLITSSGEIPIQSYRFRDYRDIIHTSKHNLQTKLHYGWVRESFETIRQLNQHTIIATVNLQNTHYHLITRTGTIRLPDNTEVDDFSNRSKQTYQTYIQDVLKELNKPF